MGDDASTRNKEPVPEKGFAALKAHVQANVVDVALWVTRIFTIIFCLCYLFPIFTTASNPYYKALLSNAASSALRLHQRLPGIPLSRERIGQFLTLLMLEDSCHNVIFSLIFLFGSPVMLVVVPIGLLALLHASSYSLTILDTLGQNSWWGARLIISLVELQSRNILKAVAFSEILLMPCCVVMILSGSSGLLAAFVYYQFLTLRYTSRRNPYTRSVFRELGLWVRSVAAKPNMPQIISKSLLWYVDMISKLAPPIPAQE